MTTRRVSRTRTTTTAATESTALDSAALDDALDRLRELALRLWAVRSAHQPRETLLRGRRCGTCGHPYPCATVRAADGTRLRASA